MMKYVSPTAPQFRDATSELSPYGDIKWKDGTAVDMGLPTEIDYENFPEDVLDSISIASISESKIYHAYVTFRGGSYALKFRELLDSITKDWFVLNSSLFSAALTQNTFELRFSKLFAKAESKTVAAEIKRLFALATFIDLEPGMTNDFSEGLEEAIEKYGKTALDKIQDLVLNDETPTSIGLEALKYVGNTDSTVWHNERRNMIETCLLLSRSAWVRDGAGLGLSFLDDPRSIPVLEKAIAGESSKALKKDLILVLDQLKETALES